MSNQRTRGIFTMTIAYYATKNPNFAEVEERIVELEKKGYTFPWKSWEKQNEFVLHKYIKEIIKAIERSEVVFADELSLSEVSTAYYLGKEIVYDAY